MNHGAWLGSIPAYPGFSSLPPPEWTGHESSARWAGLSMHVANGARKSIMHQRPPVHLQVVMAVDLSDRIQTSLISYSSHVLSKARIMTHDSTRRLHISKWHSPRYIVNTWASRTRTNYVALLDNVSHVHTSAAQDRIQLHHSWRYALRRRHGRFLPTLTLSTTQAGPEDACFAEDTSCSVLVIERGDARDNWLDRSPLPSTYH